MMSYLAASVLFVGLFFGATHSFRPSGFSSSASHLLPRQATQPTRQGPTSHPEAGTIVVYRNRRYGFSFSLPKTWEGFTVLLEHQEGGVYENSEDTQPTKMEQYPQIIIRHPLWTEANPRQDIPIMIFTHAQWTLIEKGSLIVSAAPIGPGELGQNAKYVFAIPARYNYAFPTGWEEVATIIQNKPLHPF
jgi:hypothetical protein